MSRNVYYDDPDVGETRYGIVKGKAIMREVDGWDISVGLDCVRVPESIIDFAVDNDIDEIILNDLGWRRVVYIDDLLDYGVSDWWLHQDMRRLPLHLTTRW